MLIKTRDYNPAKNARRIESIRESKDWKESDGVCAAEGQLWGLLVDSAIDPEAGIKKRRVNGWKGELSQLEDLISNRRNAGYW